MKKLITLVAVFHFVFTAAAQGLWEQKANCPLAPNGSVSFSINGIGYMYTGGASNNFYAYDPVADSWTLKADFPAGVRTGATGFGTDSFGYVGTGKNSTFQFTNNIYRYDPTTNSWAAKANYPDSLQGGFAFSINNTGYIAGGFIAPTTTPTTNRCYAYDAANDQWIAKDSLPMPMAYGFSNVANGKGYCGLGFKSSNAHTDSLYEYNPLTDDWQSKAGFHSSLLNTFEGLPSFVVGNKIYVSNPSQSTSTHSAVGVYDIALNAWSLINNFPYPTGLGCDPLFNITGLTVNGRGYLGARNNCTGIGFWEFNPADSFAITPFATDTFCERDEIQVTFASSLTFNAGNYFKLTLNGTTYNPNHATSDSVAGTTAGTYTFKVPHLLNTGNTTNAELVINSTNPPAQTAYLSNKIFVKKGPVETYLAPAYNRCDGSAILLYRFNNSSETHYWTSNPWGIVDTTDVLTLSPTQTTTIYVTDVNNATGCSASDSTVVSFQTLPNLQITDSFFSICPGGSATLGGTAVTNGAYTWSGSGLSSSLVNPVVNPVTNTTYHVTVTDSVTTCRVSGNSQVVIAQAPVQNICFVTVDSASTHNVIVWEKTDVAATDSFFIYREISTNNYQKIGAVHGDSLSEFHDYNANPNVTAYRYKIATTDTCINTSALSPYHNTIHLQYLGSGNLIWNVYQIESGTTPVNSFDVYRDSLGNGNWQVMVNVPGNQYTATDINFNQHPNALYRIVANWAYTCTASRSGSAQVMSNIISITGTGVTAIDEANNIRIYPNPAKDELYISSGNSKVEQVRIYAVDGSLLLTAQPINNRLNVSNMPSSIYIAEIKTNEGRQIKRWVKL